MSCVKLSDYVIRRIPELTGSRDVFLLSGGGMMHLLDSLGRSNDLTLVPMHHEQAAAIAADANGRVRNAVGVCFVTSGPGGTNAVTGVAGAFQESTPVLFVSGQVSRANGRGELPIRQKGIQEVAIVPIVSSITKYAVRVDNPLEIRYHLEKAIFLARSGRPGPVWLDIPLDVQGAMIDDQALQGFTPTETEQENHPPDSGVIEQILQMLRTAERPLLLLGGGVTTSGARPLVRPLVEALGMPVQTSWNGMDLIADDDPQFFGRPNLFGPRYPNFIVQNCDLLLCIGSRLGMQQTGYNVAAFAREARKIMVDVDTGEMSKPDLRIDLQVCADARRTIEAMLQSLAAQPAMPLHPAWISYCRAMRERFPQAPTLSAVDEAQYVNPYFFVDQLSRLLPARCTVPFGSSGMAHTVTGGVFRVKAGQRVFTSKGLAAMGYGLPSCIGACFASDRGLTVTVIGDGGLQLNLQDLETIRHHGLPVKLFVFNNQGYHSIRITQRNFFQGRYVGSSKESGVSLPDLAKLASAYGLRFARIPANQQVESVILEVIAGNDPVLCEVMIDPDEELKPKLISYANADGTMQSRPIEDMAPLLDRDEFHRLMLVRPIT